MSFQLSRFYLFVYWRGNVFSRFPPKKKEVGFRVSVHSVLKGFSRSNPCGARQLRSVTFSLGQEKGEISSTMKLKLQSKGVVSFEL